MSSNKNIINFYIHRGFIENLVIFIQKLDESDPDYLYAKEQLEIIRIIDEISSVGTPDAFDHLEKMKEWNNESKSMINYITLKQKRIVDEISSINSQAAFNALEEMKPWNDESMVNYITLKQYKIFNELKKISDSMFQESAQERQPYVSKFNKGYLTGIVSSESGIGDTSKKKYLVIYIFAHGEYELSEINELSQKTSDVSLTINTFAPPGDKCWFGVRHEQRLIEALSKNSKIFCPQYSFELFHSLINLSQIESGYLYKEDPFLKNKYGHNIDRAENWVIGQKRYFEKTYSDASAIAPKGELKSGIHIFCNNVGIKIGMYIPIFSDGEPKTLTNIIEILKNLTGEQMPIDELFILDISCSSFRQSSGEFIDASSDPRLRRRLYRRVASNTTYVKRKLPTKITYKKLKKLKPIGLGKGVTLQPKKRKGGKKTYKGCTRRNKKWQRRI